MRAKCIVGIVALAVLLFLCFPANGFKLKNPLKNTLGIPDPIVDQLGSLMFATKVKQCTPCESKDDVNRVNEVWSRLLSAVPDSQPFKNAKPKEWQWEMALIEKVGVVDAEAFPGGKIIVTALASGLSGKDPSQVAFLLGHEMAHALARHAKARIDGHAQTAILSAAAGGTLNASKVDPKVTLAVMAAMGVAYEGAVVKPFSREQEVEADQNALFIMAQAGYDPQASIEYLEKIKTLDSNVKHSFMNDHPPVVERIASLKKAMPNAQKIYQKAKG